MDLLGLLNINQLAVALSKLNMFPYFDAAHYIVSVMSLREQPGALDVSRRSPFACWFSAMLYCFGGAVLSGIIMAEAPIEPLANSTNILFASLMWSVHQFNNSPHPIRLVLTAMKEVTRTWKVMGGVTQASRKYKDSLFVMIAVGWAKGAGGGLMSNFEQLVRGIWKPETNELLKMTYPTKVTLIGSVLFSLQQCQYLPIQRPQLMLLYTVFTVINKTRMMLLGSSFSLLAVVESTLYQVLFARPVSCSPLTNQSNSSSEVKSTSCVTNGSTPPHEQDKKKNE
ncbi:Trimeric intracellular cation channel type B [Bagarius yarrelli]|uniref:Trimeric intracellular cation channel type B n=1 Tax=Bagarius yarrelli TaxID=175774 RepID=A0A556TWW2_BAGYA|nr:Trimeric intracellular cation channel type B [Bagarius yarrelli]